MTQNTKNGFKILKKNLFLFWKKIFIDLKVKYTVYPSKNISFFIARAGFTSYLSHFTENPLRVSEGFQTIDVIAGWHGTHYFLDKIWNIRPLCGDQGWSCGSIQNSIHVILIIINKMWERTTNCSRSTVIYF